MTEESLFRKKERDGMHFHSKKRSQKGTIGFVLAVLCVLVFLVLCVASAVAGGAAGEIVGVIGLLLAVVSGVAFWLSLQGLKERDVYTKLPFAGLLIAGLVFIVLFCLYVTGIQF
ncbi:MAG: hypothetical protein IJW37_06260 [Lachnospiraceae bacterium]|nr:hypothetical protein [Lachnospiraceae bacterium]